MIKVVGAILSGSLADALIGKGRKNMLKISRRIALCGLAAAAVAVGVGPAKMALAQDKEPIRIALGDIETVAALCGFMLAFSAFRGGTGRLRAPAEP